VLVVERVTLRDPDGVLSALVADGEQSGVRFVRRLVDDWASHANRFDRPGEALYAATLDGQLVGVCGLNVDPYTDEPGVGRVRHLYVLRAHRRLGIGQRLVEAVVDAARGRFERLRLSTQNPAAAGLYERLGFRATAGVAHCTHLLPLGRIEVLETMTLDRIADFSDADREGLRALSAAVYPPQEVADWPGRRIEWATAEWGVRIRDVEGAVLSYVGIALRRAQLDGRPVHVGGIGGVKTHPAARRRGLAERGMQRAIEFFREQPDVAFALLVCAPHLLPYYGRLGWREFTGRLLVRQRGATEAFTFNRVMTYGVQGPAPVSGTIDLLGPPW
jgi:ribosomal protein S18 acetylase RimI-like enzyme